MASCGLAGDEPHSDRHNAYLIHLASSHHIGILLPDLIPRGGVSAEQ